MADAGGVAGVDEAVGAVWLLELLLPQPVKTTAPMASSEKIVFIIRIYLKAGKFQASVQPA